MKTGKITAKLRDAVPVCLMVDGEEVMRYKNIELPNSIKEIEMLDFQFNPHMDGKITFDIHYEEGALPEIFPEARTPARRAAKAAAQAPQNYKAPNEEPTETSMSEPEAPATTELAFGLTGIPRKNLVIAVSEYTGAEPEYKAAPSFAYQIGAYMVGKDGTLTGPANPGLEASLKEQGFIPAK